MNVKTTDKSASKTKKTSSLRKNILSLAIIQVLACGSAPLYATNITVDSTADAVTNDGNCTLREAIQSANNNTAVDSCLAGAGNDTISFNNALSGSTITLGGNQLSIATDLTIDGDLDDDGAPDITVDAADASRVFIVSPGLNTRNVILEGLTIRGGNVTGNGGGVFCQTTSNNKYCNVTISNSIVTGNNATGSGGGIGSEDDSAFTLTNSTVSNNTSGGIGGGIRLTSNSVLTLTNSTVSGNNSNTRGGGIFTDSGNFTVTNSTISGNESNSRGGGIYNNSGSLTVTNSTISGNESNSRGGGIYSYEGDTTLTSSTISGNVAGSSGGGIYINDASLTVSNSTISGNSTTASTGGGIYAYYGNLNITNSTITNNSANTSGGGIFIVDITTFNIVNTILANNINGDCAGDAMDTGSNNLVMNDSCSISTVSTADPQLGVLANNGGPTFTHLPMVGSPVLDAGNNADCGTGNTIATDQRGVARDDGSCDIGAVEGTVSIAPTTSVQFDSTTATISEDGTSITLNLTRSGVTTSGISIDYTTSDGTATAPGDYSANSNTLSFATGVTSQSVTIDITDDTNVESDENFNLTLSNVQLVTGSAVAEIGANVTTTVTITDDDRASGGGGAIGWWFMFMPMVMWLRRKVK